MIMRFQKGFSFKKNIKISLAFILYFFHYIAFLSSPNKHLLKEDIDRWLRQENIQTISYGRALIFLLLYFVPFRNLFYIRIKRFSKIMRLICPPDNRFHFIHGTKIEGGLFLYHPFSTIINAKSIGKNCTIRNNITIGNVNDNNSQLPVLKDNINIGAGAIIIGDIVIGNNCIIGAGAVITKNVPDNCVVAGNPAMIIKKAGERITMAL